MMKSAAAALRRPLRHPGPELAIAVCSWVSVVCLIFLQSC